MGVEATSPVPPHSRSTTPTREVAAPFVINQTGAGDSRPKTAGRFCIEKVHTIDEGDYDLVLEKL